MNTPGRRRAGGARERRVERIIALAVAGLLAFNYPLLSLFNGPGEWFGIPLLYLYLFLVWGVFIALVGRALESRAGGRARSGSGAGDPGP